MLQLSAPRRLGGLAGLFLGASMRAHLIQIEAIWHAIGTALEDRKIWITADFSGEGLVRNALAFGELGQVHFAGHGLNRSEPGKQHGLKEKIGVTRTKNAAAPYRFRGMGGPADASFVLNASREFARSTMFMIAAI